MSRRPRGLRPEEHELWQRVAASARPFHPDHIRPAQSAKPAKKQAKPPLPEFRLGEAVRRAYPGHDVAPPPEQQLATQPLRMGRKTHQQMTRGKFQPEARIDLHGMTVAQAHPSLIRFVLLAHSEGKRLVLVITGKGKRGEDMGPIPQRVGVLRQQVPQWLKQPPLGPLVLQVVQAHIKHGGAGAFYVYLRRSRQG